MLDSVGQVEFAKSSFPDDLRLDGMKIVMDCAVLPIAAPQTRSMILALR